MDHMASTEAQASTQREITPNNRQRKKCSIKANDNTSSAIGFTLTELLICVGIIGLLSAIALPKYINSIKAARQKDAATKIANIEATMMAYREEYVDAPTSWDQVSSITPVSTYDTSGNQTTAKGNLLSIAINPTKYYKLTVSKESSINEATNASEEIFKLTAELVESPTQWTIQSCLNIDSGISDTKLNTGPQTSTINCR